jgi:DivIVA domain-containing protein
MLWFERQVVRTLTADIDAQHRPQVVDYVDSALHAMPEYLRAGVAAESLILGAWPFVRRNLGGYDETQVRRYLDRIERNPIDPVRQYARLLSSLVLLAREELCEAVS